MKFKDKKILVISPHPDDEAIGCGGLIARAVAEGASVHVLFGAVGKSRQLVTGSTDENVRLKEVDAVSKYAGYSFEFMYVGDEFMRLDSLPQKSLIEKIEDCVNKNKPDVVLVPYRNSYDQDHRAIHTAAITALRPTPRAVRHFVPIVLEFDEPYEWSVGDAFVPNFYLDITDYFDKKIETYKLHATQVRAEPFARSVENLRRRAMVHGIAVGGGLAEAYRVLRYFE